MDFEVEKDDTYVELFLKNVETVSSEVNLGILAT